MTGIDPLLIFVGFVYVEFIDFKLELNLTKVPQEYLEFATGTMEKWRSSYACFGVQ